MRIVLTQDKNCVAISKEGNLVNSEFAYHEDPEVREVVAQANCLIFIGLCVHLAALRVPATIATCGNEMGETITFNKLIPPPLLTDFSLCLGQMQKCFLKLNE